jgi:hypothetical protein
MRNLFCRVCGEQFPADWTEVGLIEGRRVLECGTCGARFPWHLCGRHGLGLTTANRGPEG